MRIRELTAFHVRIPLKRVIRHASHARTSTDNLVVVCRLENGITGYGEGVPRDYVTGETIDSAMSLLKGTDWKTWMPASLVDFAQAVHAMEALSLPEVLGDTRRCQGNAARCAVELALLDAYGQAYQQPLNEVTRLLAPSLFEAKAKVQYSTAITSAKGIKAKLTGWLMRAYGFRQCKVKVGIEGQDDVARLRTIRKAMGPKMELRIDANEAWTPEEVETKMAALEPFGITSLEQPVPHEQVKGLAAVRSRIKTPIMHDESLCSMVDAEAAVRDSTCDLFNLRLSKCGGFIPSLRLAEFAQRNGLGYQLGCQVGETAILSAAGRHWACSVKGIRALEGSYDRRLVHESLAERDITFGWGGWAPALPGGGLGIRISSAALERVTIRKEVLYG
jgi:L-Ala-D/L-Glu epimerase